MSIGVGGVIAVAIAFAFMLGYALGAMFRE